MASLATIGTIASIGAAVVGTGAALYGAHQSAEAAKSAGSAAREAQYYIASQEEALGREEFAAAQREARERALESELIMSRQLAVAAASGGGAGDDAPTIVKLMTRTAERGDYATRSVLYQGESARDRYYASARGRRKSGDASFLGSLDSAFGAYIGGLGSLAGGVGRIGDILRT